MANEHLTSSPIGEFVMFASGDGKVRVECRFESDTLWLSQAMICKLYGKAKATISEHIKHIFEEGELEENSVVRFYRTTASDGKNYQVQHFSLPLILAVGYRVRSPRGTQFRQWATQTLQEYLITINTPVNSSALRRPRACGSRPYTRFWCATRLDCSPRSKPTAEMAIRIS